MLIQFGTDTLKPILQILCRPFDRCNIVPVELFPEVPYGAFDSSLLDMFRTGRVSCNERELIS